MKKSLSCAVVGLSGAMLLSGLVIASPQSALAEEPEPCATGLGLEAPSTEEAENDTPVITIHGLWGKVGSWTDGDTPMSSALESVEGVYPFYFDYELENDRWVTNSDAAHRLAETIVCFSLLYDGKDVVLVTHSMGGLLAREALDWAADGTFVKDVVGHAITIAPPHEGSALANLDADFWLSTCTAPFPGIFVFFVEDACRQIEEGRATSGLSIDSEQLADLPKFPESVTVKTIAGDATWRVCAPWGCSPGIDQNSDLVVSVDSATAEYTETGVADGKAVFECDTSVPASMISDAWCEHSNMLQAEQVQQEVKASIEAYLTSLRGEIHEFYGLQLTLPPEWTVDTGPEAGYLYSEIQYHNQDYCPPGGRYCPLVTVFDNSTSKWQDLDTIHIEDGVLVAEYDCRGSAYLPPVLVSEVDIGGEVAQLYEHVSCPEYDGVPHKRSWVILTKRVVITDQPGSDGSRSEGFDEILANATWS